MYRAIDTASKTLGLLVAVVIVHSVVFDWLYLSGIDPVVFEFMTLTDHVASGIKHLPTLATELGFLSVLVLSADMLKATRRRTFLSPFLVVGWVNVLLAVGLSFYSFQLKMLHTFAYLTIVMLAGLSLVPQGMLKGLSPVFGYRRVARVVLCYHVLVLVVLSGAVLGVRDARFDLSGLQKGHDVALVGGNSIMAGTILRSMERGVLLRRSGDGRVLFVPWHEVGSMETAKGPQPEAKGLDMLKRLEGQ